MSKDMACFERTPEKQTPHKKLITHSEPTYPNMNNRNRIKNFLTKLGASEEDVPMWELVISAIALSLIILAFVYSLSGTPFFKSASGDLEYDKIATLFQGTLGVAVAFAGAIVAISIATAANDTIKRQERSDFYSPLKERLEKLNHSIGSLRICMQSIVGWCDLVGPTHYDLVVKYREDLVKKRPDEMSIDNWEKNLRIQLYKNLAPYYATLAEILNALRISIGKCLMEGDFLKFVYFSSEKDLAKAYNIVGDPRSPDVAMAEHFSSFLAQVPYIVTLLNDKERVDNCVSHVVDAFAKQINIAYENKHRAEIKRESNKHMLFALGRILDEKPWPSSLLSKEGRTPCTSGDVFLWALGKCCEYTQSQFREGCDKIIKPNITGRMDGEDEYSHFIDNFMETMTYLPTDSKNSEVATSLIQRRWETLEEEWGSAHSRSETEVSSQISKNMKLIEHLQAIDPLFYQAAFQDLMHDLNADLDNAWKQTMKRTEHFPILAEIVQTQIELAKNPDTDPDALNRISGMRLSIEALIACAESLADTAESEATQMA